LLNIRIQGRRAWLQSVSLALIAFFALLLPAAALADQAVLGQQAASQDFLATIVWTIAALSLAEMIRNSIQGLFSRLYGFNESGAGMKAVGAIAGMGSLFGLANVMRATAGEFMGGGRSEGRSSSGAGGGSISLSGETSYMGGESVLAGMTTGGEGDKGVTRDGGATGEMASALGMKAGQTSGLEKATGTGNQWGRTLGSLARRATTAIAAMGMGMAGMAIPGGDHLVQAGVNVFDKTVGAAAGYAGSAAGRFAGVQGSLLGHSLQTGKRAQKLTGGQIGVAESFRMVAGGATVQDAIARSLKLGGACAVHEKAGQFILGGMQNEAAANSPAKGKMDSGVNYKSQGWGGYWDYDW
jgi:hypothetical protein